MPNICPTTPYSKTNPYSTKESPFTSKENPYSSKVVYSKMDSPYFENQYCPDFLMLIDDIHFLEIDWFGNKLKI
jgi:hypothetical protein